MPPRALFATAIAAAVLQEASAKRGGEAVAGAAPAQRGGGKVVLLPFGSLWRIQPTGAAVPDGDEWWVRREGVGWLHPEFGAEGWPVARTPVGPAGVLAGESTTVYGRAELRLTARAFTTAELTLQTAAGVGAVVFVNGCPVLEVNMPPDEQFRTNGSTSFRATTPGEVTVPVDGRYGPQPLLPSSLPSPDQAARGWFGG